MSQTNSALMSIITQYTKQFVDKISELENENYQLKQKVGANPSSLKGDFDKLTERHSELKISYAEIERENTKLRQDMDQLIAQQDLLQADVAKHFQQVFSKFTAKQAEQIRTPKKTYEIHSAPSQKPLHREAKATTKLLNTEYESDSSNSDTDDEMPALVSASENESVKFIPRKLNFAVRADQDPNQPFLNMNNVQKPNNLNLSDHLPKEDGSDEEKDDYESILKQIITEGLMTGLENINRSPNNAAQLNTARPDSRNGKRHRGYLPSRKHRYNVPLYSRNQTPSESNPEQNNNFPFNFVFAQPQHGVNHDKGQGFGNMQQSSTTGNSHSNQQEAELVQKILETLFTPNK
jgi:hypothetical protein